MAPDLVWGLLLGYILKCQNLNFPLPPATPLKTSLFLFHSPKDGEIKKIVLAKVFGLGAWFLAYRLVFSNII